MILCRVVCALLVTIDSFCRMMAFSNVLFPAFGFPTMATYPAFVLTSTQTILEVHLQVHNPSSRCALAAGSKPLCPSTYLLCVQDYCLRSCLRFHSPLLRGVRAHQFAPAALCQTSGASAART